jgi:hypothetical protein
VEELERARCTNKADLFKLSPQGERAGEDRLAKQKVRNGPKYFGVCREARSKETAVTNIAQYKASLIPKGMDEQMIAKPQISPRIDPEVTNRLGV